MCCWIGCRIAIARHVGIAVAPTGAGIGQVGELGERIGYDVGRFLEQAS